MNYILWYLLAGFTLNWIAVHVLGTLPRYHWLQELIFGVLLWPLAIILGIVDALRENRRC